ncbi:hypothetical protein FRC01_005149, partial [Tulasnella sp. 417]
MVDIIDGMPNSFDILTLALTSSRFAAIIGDEWTWRRHLALGAWNVDATIRHSQTKVERGKPWIKPAINLREQLVTDGMYYILDTGELQAAAGISRSRMVPLETGGTARVHQEIGSSYFRNG